MQPPLEFIQDYLKEQVRLYELWSSGYAPIHERFFQPTYNPFDPQKGIDRAKAETVTEASGPPDAPVVTTSGYGNGHRLRYTLQIVKGDWRICQVRLECSICRGAGRYKDESCRICRGKGWIAL